MISTPEKSKLSAAVSTESCRNLIDDLRAAGVRSAAWDVERMLAGLQSIYDWCYPEAAEMPKDARERCECYARRLKCIADAALSAGLAKQHKLERQ